jgi:hypothetical protein
MLVEAMPLCACLPNSLSTSFEQPVAAVALTSITPAVIMVTAAVMMAVAILKKKLVVLCTDKRFHAGVSLLLNLCSVVES